MYLSMNLNKYGTTEYDTYNNQYVRVLEATEGEPKYLVETEDKTEFYVYADELFDSTDEALAYTWKGGI